LKSSRQIPLKVIAQPWSAERPLGGYMPYARDPEHAARLWTVSEQLVAR
jgi:hypothetical protein